MMMNDALILIRKYHDLNQTELADKIGLPKSRISEIENFKKKPSLDIIEKYSLAFNIPLSSIMFFAEALPNAQKGDKVRVKIGSKIINILKYIESKADAETT